MMKRVRKIIAIFVLLILMIPSGVLASTFTVDENMYIDIDDSLWYVFTRDNIANNKELDSLDLSYEYMDNFFKKNNAYLDALLIYKDSGEILELFIRRVNSGGAINSSNYSNEDFLNKIKQDLSSRNPSVLDIYETNGYKYGYAEYTDQGYYLIDYYVIINGYNYTITAQKVNEFNTDNKARVKAIVDSISFNINKDLKEPNEGGFFDTILGKALIGAIIGGAIGGLSALVMSFTKKNSKQKNNMNNNMYNNGYYNPNQYNNNMNGYNNGNYYNNGNNGYNNNGNYYDNNNYYNNNNNNGNY